MKKDFFLVSVIMNCHNGEKYLKKSINSLIKQTYRNWELIFWDNKSTDNSKKIVKEFKDKRIKYFYSKSFCSLYKSRNLAINKAKGEYLAFLDTDDFWQKNKIKHQINFIKKKNLKICYSNFYLFFQKSRFKKKYINYKFSTSPQFFLKNYNIGILTILLEKKFFNKIKFNSKYQIIGDFDYFIKLSLKNQIGYIEKPLATYRIHGENYSIKNLGLYIKELSFWLKKNKSLINKNNLTLIGQKKLLIKLRIQKFLNYFNVFKN